MKQRVGIFVSFLFLLFSAPSLLPASPIVAPIAHPDSYRVAFTELPWSTVQAVLKKVAEQGHYTYAQLVVWYNQDLVTVEQSGGGGYVVMIYDADGLLDVLLIETY